MVAAEAASAGVLPVSAAHSGALEVSRALAAELPDEAAGLVSFEVDDGPPTRSPTGSTAGSRLDPRDACRDRASRLRETAVRLWSWEGVARSVIEASR